MQALGGLPRPPRACETLLEPVSVTIVPCPRCLGLLGFRLQAPSILLSGCVAGCSSVFTVCANCPFSFFSQTIFVSSVSQSPENALLTGTDYVLLAAVPNHRTVVRFTAVSDRPVAGVSY